MNSTEVQHRAIPNGLGGLLGAAILVLAILMLVTGAGMTAGLVAGAAWMHRDLSPGSTTAAIASSPAGGEAR